MKQVLFLLYMLMIDKTSYKRLSHLIRSEGEHNSKLMYKAPTALETRMKNLLDANGVSYKFQKLLYRFVKGYREYVEAYYIANFWFPKKHLIINLQDGPRKFKVKSEGLRTFDYDGIAPAAQVIKINEEDFNCPSFTDELMAILK